MNYFTNHWESDCSILEAFLHDIEFYSGTERRTGQFKTAKTTKGNGSMLYGTTWKSFLKYDEDGNKILREKDEETGLYKTKCKALYPYLDDVFKEFSELYFKDFEWDQVQLNRNYQCPKHVDSLNIGNSILLTLGDFNGGETIVEVGEEQITYDSHNKLVTFNGSKFPHWTADFTGNRYALVFFRNHKCK